MWGTEGAPSVLDMDGVSSVGRWDAAWGLDPRAVTEPRRLTSLLNKRVKNSLPLSQGDSK